jgi:hypothetical protein
MEQTDPASAAFRAWCSASQAYHQAADQGWSTDQLRGAQQDLERARSRSDIASAASAVVQRRERPTSP